MKHISTAYKGRWNKKTTFSVNFDHELRVSCDKDWAIYRIKELRLNQFFYSKEYILILNVRI